MAMKRNRFDKELKENGKWFTYEEGTDDECQLKIASSNSIAFAKAIGEKSAKEDNDEGIEALLAESIVLDWEGFEEDDGTVIPYSVEECTEFLKGDLELLSFVLDTMKSKDAYRREVVAKKAKK